MVWLVKYKVRPREGGKANIPATRTNKIAMVKYYIHSELIGKQGKKVNSAYHIFTEVQRSLKRNFFWKPKKKKKKFLI